MTRYSGAGGGGCGVAGGGVGAEVRVQLAVTDDALLIQHLPMYVLTVYVV